MKYLLPLLCLLLLPPALAQRKLTTADADYKAISETITSKSIALINQDTVFLSRLTGDDFKYINSLGKTLDKKAYIAGIASGKIRFVSQRAQVSSITKTGRTYCVTAQLQDEFIYEGRRVVQSSNTVNIFVKKRRKITWIFGQSTEIAH